MKSIDAEYIARLKKMGPVKRLLIAIELTEIVKKIAIAGIKNMYPNLNNAGVKKKLRERISLLYNKQSAGNVLY